MKDSCVIVYPGTWGSRHEGANAYVVGMTEDHLGVVFAFEAVPEFLENTQLRFSLQHGFIVLAFRPHTGAKFVEVHTGQELIVEKLC